jgi:hypothetical protein
LPTQIGEGFVGEILELPHAVLDEQVEGFPGLLIELNALAGHREYPVTIPRHLGSSKRGRRAGK